jgi:hypothetical protein
VKAVIGNHEHLVAETIAGMMARAKRQCIVRIKIQIEVRPGIGAPEACKSIPGRADLQIEAPAQESHRGGLHGGLQLHILPDTDRGVRARPHLSAKNLIGVRTDPCARIIGAPAKIDVSSEIVGVGIFADRELPRQACAAVRRSRARRADEYAHTAGYSDPHNGDCSRFECIGGVAAGVPDAGSSSVMQ